MSIAQWSILVPSETRVKVAAG